MKQDGFESHALAHFKRVVVWKNKTLLKLKEDLKMRKNISERIESEEMLIKDYIKDMYESQTNYNRVYLLCRCILKAITKRNVLKELEECE